MTTIGSARRSAQLAALVVAVVLVALAFLLALVFPAHAHDKWADGTAVPAWVKSACCGPNDVHMDPHLTRTDTGYIVDGHAKHEVPFRSVLPSADGHVCAFCNPLLGEDGYIYCLFIPMSM
jgi:hypothetical protein